MIGIFKQKNPGNALLLMLYGLVLKFPLFLHPVMALTSQGDNYLYKFLLRTLEPLTGNSPTVFSLLAFLLFFTQATLLNRISNSLKFFQRSNFLVGMSFMLVTSLIPEWTYFSAPLLVNSLMIWILYRMIGLYNNNAPKTSIFNVAVLVGILPLIYGPAVSFVLMLFFALIITRPLRVTEWMVALLGLFTPYYFVFVILFLTDRWNFRQIVPYITFHLPKLQASIWISGALVILALPFLTGGYHVQDNLNKMLIQVRKAWSLMLFYLVIGALIILFNPGENYLHWMLVTVPVACFHAATYYYMTKRWFAILLHWISFIFCIMVNYGIFTKL